MNIGNFAGNVGNVRFGTVNSQSGPISVLNFSIGVTRREKGPDGKNLTLWVDCALWGKRAEALQQYVTKGSKVAVCGELGVETYQGANGVMPKLTCKVSELTLMTPRSEQQQCQPQQQRQAPPPAQQAAPQQYQQAPAPQQPDAFDEEIPF